MTIIVSLIILLSYIGISECGRVLPYGSEFVILSNTNPNSVADYYFSMIFQTNMTSTGYVEIIFPQNQYATGLTPATAVIMAPYPTVVASAIINQWSVIIPLPNWKKNVPIQICIKDVYNPSKEGGTGQFLIQTLTSYDIVSTPIVPGTILDQSKHFTVVGLSSSVSSLISAYVGFYNSASQLAGETSSYLFSLVPSTDLVYNVDFRITFPDIYDLSDLDTTQCISVKNSVSAARAGTFACEVLSTSKNVLTFKGNSAAIVKGTNITLALIGATNPVYSLQTDLFKFQIMLASTNSTVESSLNVIGLTIQPGVIDNVKLSLYYPTYSKYQYFARRFVLAFKPTNPFLAARIVTDFESISSCQITAGLFDKTINSNSVCTPFANLIEVSNFQQYTRSEFSNEYITIQFEAVIKPYPLLSSDVLSTQPLTISTFKDTAMLYIADQNSSSTSTQLAIEVAPQLYPSTTPANTDITISLSSTIALTSSVTLSILVNYLYLPGVPATAYIQPGGVIQIELPEEFTGVPKCTFYTSATTYKDYTCVQKSGAITVTLTDSVYSFLVNSTPGYPYRLVVSGLINPEFPDDYIIRANMHYKNSALVEYVFSKPTTFTITAPFLAGSTGYSLFSNQPLSNSVLFISISYDLDLASGVKTLSDPFAEYSIIDIGLQYGGSFFQQDLGLGVSDMDEIDCVGVAGISSANNYEMHCSLFMTLDPNYVIVRVQDFGEVQKLTGRVMTIGIPLVYASNTVIAPQYYIKLYSSTNKIVRLLTQLPITSMVTASGSVPGAGGPTSVTPASVALQTQSSMTIPLPLSTSLPTTNINGFYFLIPSGYAIYSTPIVSVAGTTYVKDTNYFVLSRLSGLLFVVPSLVSAGTVNIIINQMTTPNWYSASYLSTLYVSKAGSYVQAQTISFTLPTLTTINSLALNIDYPDPNLRWAKYTFEFKVEMSYINVLEFSFPASFQIVANDPYVELINPVNLVDLSSTSTMTLSSAANKLFITNFAVTDTTVVCSVTFTQITNPSAGSYPVTVTFRKAAGAGSVNAVQQNIVNAVVTGSSFSAETVTFLADSINSLPNNLNGYGIYTFQFTTTYLIPKGSTVIITFPVEFTSFFQKQSSYVRCREQSSILFLSDCEYVSSTQNIKLVTYADSDPTKPVILEYYGLVLNQFTTFSSNFDMNIYFKGTTAANIIFNTGTGVQPTITPAYTELAGCSLNYYPTNEGERAFYEFTLTLTSATTALLADYSILVTFPLNYDDNLGPYNLTISSDQLNGALKYKQYRRTIVVYGFYAMTVTKPIVIKIFGIVNPNRSTVSDYQSELFGVGLLGSKTVPTDIHGYSLIEASYSILNISPELAPGGVNFISLASTTTYARTSANFTFIIEPLQNVLSTTYGGQLYFDFPQDFIIDSFDGTCNINKGFSLYANCLMQNENLRFFFETNNDEWDSSASGYITALVNLVRSPDSKGTTSNFIAYNYDSINKKVLGRTYPNLFIASLTFAYDGYLISVNNDIEYDLEVGSVSDLITIDFDVDVVNYSAESTLTLTPNVLDASIIISPNPVIISYKSTSATFTIAAPRTILLKTFYITWSKTGDTFPSTYADLRKTKVNMVKGVIIRKVRLENIPFIPTDGESYPLYIRVPNPPYSGLSVYICFDNLFTGAEDYAGYQAKVNTTMSTFDITTYKTAYTVFFRNNLTGSTVNIYYQLGGVDMDSYQLFIYDVDELVDDVEYDPLLGQTINNVVADYTAPNFISAAVKLDALLKPIITRTSVTLTFQTDQKGFIFYTVANKRIPIPVFDSLHEPSSNYTLSFSNPMYGTEYIRKTNLKTEFTISDLTAGIDYEIYFYLMNMNLVNNPTYTKIAFSTLKPQNIAAFTLKLSQSTVTSDIKSEYISKMADLVSISSSRIIERSTNCKDANLDVSSDPSILYWNLLLMPDPTNEDYLVTPINIVSQLNQRRSSIQDFIPRLDSESFITMKNLSTDIPQFYTSPYMNTRTISSIKIDLSLTFCGTVSIVAIPRVGSENSTLVNTTNLLSGELPTVIYPTSYEITQGLNMTNLPVDDNLKSTFYVDSIKTINTATFSGLDDRTVYDFYVTAINDFTKYNYYMPDAEVVKLSIKTKKDVIPLNVTSILSATVLRFALWLLPVLLLGFM